MYLHGFCPGFIPKKKDINNSFFANSLFVARLLLINKTNLKIWPTLKRQQQSNSLKFVLGIIQNSTPRRICGFKSSDFKLFDLGKRRLSSVQFFAKCECKIL